MIKFPRWIIIFAFMLSIASTLGVIFIFNKILERGGLIDIFTFLTIPLIIGSILEKENHKTEKNLFLASSAFSLLAFIFIAALGNYKVLLWILYIGIFLFSFGLFRLALKSIVELREDLFNFFKED